jgi:hypothetical protein
VLLVIKTINKLMVQRFVFDELIFIFFSRTLTRNLKPTRILLLMKDEMFYKQIEENLKFFFVGRPQTI